VQRTAAHFEQCGFDVTLEYTVPGGGVIDVLATRPGERVAIEIETGKSDIAANLLKLHGARFDRAVLLATSPAAIAACDRTLPRLGDPPEVELKTWLDVS
jgi:hypothetical protein